MTALSDRLRDEGGISFREFMDATLYGADGYYSRHAVLGTKSGDFFTAAQLPLFGATLGRYVQDVWKSMGAPQKLQIVEYGAGQGELALSVCRALARRLPAGVEWTYVIVEKSDYLRTIQRDRLVAAADDLPVSWSQPDPRVATVLIANEVLDALPVERLRRTADGWEQAFVLAGPGGQLVVEWRPAPSGLSQLASRWLPIPVGTTAELCPAFPDWFRDAAGCGRPLRLLAFDYGIHLSDWRNGLRPEGTVRAYRRHQLCSPLTAPGEVDITADVHWDFAMDCARAAGLEVLDLVTQGKFLVDAGIVEVAQEAIAADPAAQHRVTAQLKQLILPGAMGERFAVLVCNG